MAQTASTGVNQQGNFEGTCTSFFFCFFDGSSAANQQQSLQIKKAASRRSVTISQTAVERGHDEELLDDLELVLEGRGLISTIFLPSKSTVGSSSSSMPRTAFIRCKKGDSKVECQVVVDNDVVSNGTLKRFKFSAFDVTRVSKGRDKNSLIPAVVEDSLIMRFTIVNKGELHFVFESQHVRDDIVQGFKLLIAKKKATIPKPTPKISGKENESAKPSLNTQESISILIEKNDVNSNMNSQEGSSMLLSNKFPLNSQESIMSVSNRQSESDSEISSMDGEKGVSNPLIQQTVELI